MKIIFSFVYFFVLFNLLHIFYRRDCVGTSVPTVTTTYTWWPTVSRSGTLLSFTDNWLSKCFLDKTIYCLTTSHSPTLCIFTSNQKRFRLIYLQLYDIKLVHVYGSDSVPGVSTSDCRVPFWVPCWSTLQGSWGVTSPPRKPNLVSVARDAVHLISTVV